MQLIVGLIVVPLVVVLKDGRPSEEEEEEEEASHIEIRIIQYIQVVRI